MLDQTVISAAANDLALRAQLLGDIFERRMAIVIEPAHQPGIARPGDPDPIETVTDLPEKIRRFCGEKIVDQGCAVDNREILVLLAVEDP